jgi:16S rRNA (adenine1518-N6/adenine1519-N6)-dimethyltransferase
VTADALLGPAEIREIAGRLGIRPAKRLGQNFVVDPGTVRRIAALADVRPGDVVLEVGPGFGSLTLGLLGAARRVVAVEVDPVLAAELPRTVAVRAPELAPRLAVVTADAVKVTPADLPGVPGGPDLSGGLGGAEAGESKGPDGADEAEGPGEADESDGAGPPGEPPSVLVANLPYNVAVPVVLHLLTVVPSLARGLVMVQAEVADRMTAPPGSRVYGVPSVKLAWFASARRAGPVPRTVFWPVPNVDSGLVAFTRRPPPEPRVTREEVFAVVAAAFAQRRKTLRAALARWAGGPDAAERILRGAGVDPGARGESLTVGDFARIARYASAVRARTGS